MNNQDLQMEPLRTLIKYQPRVEDLEIIRDDVKQVCDWLETERRKQGIRESRSRILATFLKYKGLIRNLQNQIIERDLALESKQLESEKLLISNDDLRREIADIKASYGFKAVV